MYVQCLLLATLIFSAAGRFDPYLTRVSDAWAVSIGEEVSSTTQAIQKAVSLPVRMSHYPRGSSCWWMWVLSGVELCEW